MALLLSLTTESASHGPTVSPHLHRKLSASTLRDSTAVQRSKHTRSITFDSSTLFPDPSHFRLVIHPVIKTAPNHHRDSTSLRSYRDSILRLIYQHQVSFRRHSELADNHHHAASTLRLTAISHCQASRPTRIPAPPRQEPPDFQPARIIADQLVELVSRLIAYERNLVANLQPSHQRRQ